jgi:phosphoribosylformylglycinamidine synthase subunit PurS
MRFIAEINVMPLKIILDPQGKPVMLSLHKLGFDEISHIKIGKHISLEIEAVSKEVAIERINEACQKLLHNPVTEGYEYDVKLC